MSKCYLPVDCCANTTGTDRAELRDGHGLFWGTTAGLIGYNEEQTVDVIRVVHIRSSITVCTVYEFSIDGFRPSIEHGTRLQHSSTDGSRHCRGETNEGGIYIEIRVSPGDYLINTWLNH